MALQSGDHAVGAADLGRVGGGIEGAVQPVVGLDVVALAEGADGPDAVFGGLDQADRLGESEQPFQGEELGRPGQRAAAVAAAGAGAAEVGLDQHHIEPGIVLLEHDGGPQAGVAAADDAHVGAGIPGQRRAGCRMFGA